MAGIILFGGYVPRRRLQRSAIYAANRWFAPGLKGLSAGERSVAGWDEDSVTMAVEAARDCLGDHPREEIGNVFLASTTHPNADRQNAGIVKEALVLNDAVGALDVGGSQRAGTSMLIQAFAAAAGADKPVLALAAERGRARPGSEDELLNGDAAACLLVGADDGIARLIGHHSLTLDFVDHYRSANETYDQNWEARWVREEGHVKIAGRAIRETLDNHGLSGSDISHVIIGIAAKGAAAAVAKAGGLPAEALRDNLSAVMGHAGSAQPLVMLAHALEDAKPGERILVVGFGQGADVLLLEATGAAGQARPAMGISGWLARADKDENYMRFLALSGEVHLELGKRAEFPQKPVLTALYRNRKAVFGLVGGRCTKTGTVQFPRSEISVNQNDPARDTQEEYPLADRMARILTYTADNLTYTPDPPNYYGMVEFEGGGRIHAEFADADPDSIAVGAPMRMMFRIKAHDTTSGFSKYFWKAAPAVRRN